MTHGPRTGFLMLSLRAAACGDADRGGMTGGATGATGATSLSTGATATTGGEPTTGEGGTTGATSGASGPQTSGPQTTGPQTSGPQTTGSQTSGGSSGGEEPQFFMLADPLIDGTMGTPVGGSFGAEGWTVTDRADRVYWSVPRLVEGSVAFTISKVTLDNLPLNDHEVFAMYEGGYDIEHPIGYNPEFRNNAFKSMIRIYGQAEGDRVGKQKIMWGLCPMGAPGYHGGSCPCTSPAGFFEEPFGGDGNWDGSPQRLKVEWKDGITRYSRNDVEVLSIDWTASGLLFAPEDLFVSLGNPRPLEVDTAGMPIGAVFSDVVIEGWTGPANAVCQQ